ncbi:MAG TPA: VanZ family protein [Thermoanaerobaculia bacterium]|jgi:glycopeptide antibiotics resistance protein|nr:VanZ family protein [Thermoanaerobaculia bacterium]
MPREIIIPKWITVLLLTATTLAIVTITVWMAGKSYENFDPIPFDDLRYLAKRLNARPISTHILAVIVVPMIANVLLFVPWGFLAFIALYTVERPTLQTYVLTILLGFSFTLAIEAWQYFLPSRVADVNDVIWNTCGTIVGAVLGHARLRLRLEFD